MLYRLAVKDIKHAPIINMLIIILIVAMFFVVITIVSAIQLKYRKYSTLSPYLTQKGICIESYYLQRQIEDGRWVLIRDEEELKECLPDIKNVLSVEEIWEISAQGIKEDVTAWCYSEDVIKALKNISMQDGKWFSDETTDSDILEVVLSYNESDVKVGDIITVSTEIDNVSVPVRVIGIINNGESLFYQNFFDGPRGDCRDCFYTYDYDREAGRVIIFFSDKQILDGQKDGKFGELNYRLNSSSGFQKSMKGCTILTYDNKVDTNIIEKNTEYLSQNSFIHKVYDLDKMNRESLRYVFEELRDYLPIFACVLIFVFIASISINVITVKRQLKSYAIYYLCGLSWKKCSKISMYESVIISGIAAILVFVSMFTMKILGKLDSSALQLGWLQIGILICLSVVYVVITWVVPRLIVKGTTAKQLLAKER